MMKRSDMVLSNDLDLEKVKSKELTVINRNNTGSTTVRIKKPRPATGNLLNNRKLNQNSNSTIGKTDISLYQKIGSLSRSRKNFLSRDQLDQIESVLPCPHDPQSLSHLYLEGKSKLKLEANAAKKSSHLVVLNQLDQFS